MKYWLLVYWLFAMVPIGFLIFFLRSKCGEEKWYAIPFLTISSMFMIIIAILYWWQAGEVGLPWPMRWGVAAVVTAIGLWGFGDIEQTAVSSHSLKEEA